MGAVIDTIRVVVRSDARYATNRNVVGVAWYAFTTEP